MRTALRLLILLLAGSLVLAGCRDSRKEFTGQFAAIPLQQAPPEVRRTYEQMKALPGLFVLHQGESTYLLLLTGAAEVPGGRVEVLHLQRPAGPAGEVRVLARLLPGGGEGSYPHAVIRLEGGRGLQYKARLSTMDEQVLELHGIPIAR